MLLKKAADYLIGKRALIFGVGGQDGHFLSHFLTSKGYEVHGVVRRTSQKNPMLGLLPPEVVIHHGDITDFSSVLDIVSSVRPHEIYNLAAQSHVGISFKEPLHTTRVNYLGVVNIIEAARLVNSYEAKVYQASTSEMFGGVSKSACNETSPFFPKSPYGVAKVAAHHAVVNAREAYGTFACAGILYNHESEIRPENFVTRKISLAVGAISRGEQDKLYLGNLDAKRDWGYAPDYVKGMWLMLQQETPGDYVLGTGETHSVREFCQIAFDHAGLGDYSKYVEVDPRFYRPAEVDVLVADYSKAKRELGWEPTTKFEDLVKKMVDHDLKL
jgi:GDPmannose 4,6-dehydratase